MNKNNLNNKVTIEDVIALNKTFQSFKALCLHNLRYDKGMTFYEAKDYIEKAIALGSIPDLSSNENDEKQYSALVRQVAEIISSRVSLACKKYLTLSEAAAYLGVEIGYMYKMSSRKKIKVYKPGGRLAFVLKEELDDFIKSGECKPRDVVD